jgi:hypothetical protein
MLRRNWLQRVGVVLLGATVVISQVSVQAALVFNLTSTGNADADAGFQRAADYVSGQFDDAIEVNITAGFASLGGSVLGQAASPNETFSFANWKAAVAADVSSSADATYSAGLPAGNAFSVYINRTSDNPNGSGSAVPYVDNDGGANNTTVRINRANAKAIGLLAANDAAEDAAITFSSDFVFDFDPSDGIDAGAIDFVGVAIHEIMHAMGFESGVDILDGNSPGSGGPFDDDLFDYVSALDFTRHSNDSLLAGADIDFTADTRAKLYSLDSGATTLIADAWSTGVTHGDGRQASHWRDGLGIGIMDPTAAPAGSLNVVSANDLQALDVIGWNTVAVVPEPSSCMLAWLAIVGLACDRYRRRRSLAAVVFAG